MHFKNARLQHYSSVLEEGAPVYRLHFSADPSPEVCSQMGWDIVDEEGSPRLGTKKSTLIGLVRVSDITLTPESDNMANHAITIPAVELRSFAQASRVEDEVRVSELRFVAIITSGIGKVDRWWKTAGKLPAILSATVLETQMELGDEEEETEEPAESVTEEEPTSGRRRRRATAEEGPDTTTHNDEPPSEPASGRRRRRGGATAIDEQ